MTVMKVTPTSAVPVYDAGDGELDCGGPLPTARNSASAFNPGNRAVHPVVVQGVAATPESGAGLAGTSRNDNRVAPLPPPATPSTCTPKGEEAACNGSYSSTSSAMNGTNQLNPNPQSFQDLVANLQQLQQVVDSLNANRAEKEKELETYRLQNVELLSKLKESQASPIKDVKEMSTMISNKILKQNKIRYIEGTKGRNAHEIMVTSQGRIKMLHRSRDKAEANYLQIPKSGSSECVSSSCSKGPLDLATRPNPLREHMSSAPRKPTEILEDSALVAVEFDCLEAVCCEDHATVMVPVSRIGVLHGRLTVDWIIHAASGLPEKVYQEIQPKRGTVVFEDGQDRVLTEMPVASDPTWNVESVYFAMLDPKTFTTFPDSTLERRCVVGQNSQVAVYSLNTNAFPAGVDAGETSLVTLLWGFIRHNYTEIPSESVKGLVYSVFTCVHYYCSARVLELLLDCGVSLAGEGACEDFDFLPGAWFIWALATSQFFLFVLQVVFQIKKEKLRLDGKAIRMLRTNMFTTMLDFSQEAKSSFDPGDVPKALDTQVTDAIMKCWLNFFVLVELTLVCVVQWFVTYQMASESPELSFEAQIGLYASTPMMIVMMAFIMYIRSGQQFAIFSVANQADETWSAFVTMTEFCIPLILSYRQGHVAARTFHEVHQKFNKANGQASDYSTGTIWRIRTWFQMVFFGVVVVGGAAVQRGTLKIGGFVVIMNAVLGLGSTLTEVTTVMNDMVIGCAAIRKIADILNKDTRRIVRWRKSKENHDIPHRKCPDAVDGLGEDIGVHMEMVEYTYPDSHKKSVCPTNLQLTCRSLICFPEETLAACKKWGSGIATLFKLMSCDLPPTRGAVELFPARWSVICVPAHPILFDGTLMYNLAYSESQSHAPVSSDDIWNMCRALGMSDHLIGDEDLDVGFNGEHLKLSDRIIVSLARALLYNADVILISSALDVLGERHGLQALRYLRGYIQRGELSEDPERLNQRGLLPLKFKHTKTVLYVSKFGVLQQEADHNVVALINPPGYSPHDGAQQEALELN